jgi:hypothetical protein
VSFVLFERDGSRDRQQAVSHQALELEAVSFLMAIEREDKKRGQDDDV